MVCRALSLRPLIMSVDHIAHDPENDVGDFCSQQWGNRVAYLMELLGPVSLKEIIVGEGLQTSRFANRETAALVRVRVDEVMAILGYVAGDRGGRMIL